tara:strand:- start:41 stop:232 length:192 start_codon:yes stop_codon:yes gene_type:complete
MQKFMYTIAVVEDYIFEAEDRKQAEDIAGLIRAVDDPDTAKELVESKNGFVHIDMSESIMEEE